jgi:hypothetical protein
MGTGDGVGQLVVAVGPGAPSLTVGADVVCQTPRVSMMAFCAKAEAGIVQNSL